MSPQGEKLLRIFYEVLKIQMNKITISTRKPPFLKNKVRSLFIHRSEGKMKKKPVDFSFCYNCTIFPLLAHFHIKYGVLVLKKYLIMSDENFTMQLYYLKAFIHRLLQYVFCKYIKKHLYLENILREKNFHR